MNLSKFIHSTQLLLLKEQVVSFPITLRSSAQVAEYSTSRMLTGILRAKHCFHVPKSYDVFFCVRT